MSIETALLLTSTTALQGWFEARGVSLWRGGEDALQISEGIFHRSPTVGELTSMAGRVLSTMPYLASERIMHVFAHSISNPVWVGAGLLALNVIPSIIFAMSEDKDSATAQISAVASHVMGTAMKILNLVVICSVLSAHSAPLTLPVITAVVLFGTLSSVSLVYTTTKVWEADELA